MPSFVIKPNMIIEGLKIKKILGHGAWGDVCLAYDVGDKEEKFPVCLKFCKSMQDAKKEIALGGQYFERREVVFPGELILPSSNKIINYANRFIVVIPYIHGFTLQSLLMGNQLETIDAWLGIAQSTLEQVIIDKSLSQLHRDIHTENIMIFKSPTTQKLAVSLIDFGLATDTNTDTKTLSLRPVFDGVLKFGFLGGLVMRAERYARRIPPEHQSVSATSSVGFRSESFGVGYLLSEILVKIDKIIKMGPGNLTKEQLEKIEKLHTVMSGMRNPDAMERMSLEEAFLMLASDEVKALSDLKHLLGISGEGRRIGF